MTKVEKTNDFDVRRAVVSALIDKGFPRCAIRHEITFDTNSSDGRADLVLAHDRCLIGVELKSGKDTLARIDRQRGAYKARFDHLCLVLDRRFEPETVTAAWDLDFGHLRIAERGEDGVVRLRRMIGVGGHPAPWEHRFRAGVTGERLSPFAMLSMLWASEVNTVAHTLVTRGVLDPVKAKQRCKLIPHMAENARLADLRPLVIQALRTRPLNRWEQSFWTRYDAA